MEINNSQMDSLIHELEKISEKTVSELPRLFSDTDYWLVRADGGKYYTDFNINNYIGISWNEISLDSISNCQGNHELMKNELKNSLNTEDYEEDLTEKRLGTWAGQLLRFYNNIKVNDFVLVPSEGSRTFLVGRINGEIFEYDTENDEESALNTERYKKSNYKKRYPVRWVGKFNRDEADSALYKLIYSHTTLTNANEYKTYINRALFPAYLEDDKIHLTYKVSEVEDVESLYLGQFIYQYSQMNMLIDEDNQPDTKVNVQSPGIIEIIMENPHASIIGVLLLIIFSGITIFGGEFSVFGMKYSTEGLITKLNNRKKDKIEIDLKELEKYEKATDLSKKLKVPISELNIDLPQNLAKILEKQLDEENKNTKADPDQDSESTSNE